VRGRYGPAVRLQRKRTVWVLEHDVLEQWAAGSPYNRLRLDRWLTRQGLPPGGSLRAGSVHGVVDWFGRRWVCARLLVSNDPVRVPWRTALPVGLQVTWSPARR